MPVYSITTKALPYTEPSLSEQKAWQREFKRTRQSQFRNSQRLQGAGIKKTGRRLGKAKALGALKATSGLLSRGIMGVWDIFKQIDISKDWGFVFILAPFGLLKDIIDIAFAGLSGWISGLIGWIPILGQATAASAIGAAITVSFVFNSFFLIITITVLLLSGSDLKNRGAAKYITSFSIEFMAESLPGIEWLPLTFIYAWILYFLVLLDRIQDQKNTKKSKMV